MVFIGISPVATGKLYEGKVRRQAGIFRPNITGSVLHRAFDAGRYLFYAPSGAIVGDTSEGVSNTFDAIAQTNECLGNKFVIDCSRSNSIYGSNSKVQSPAISVLVAIRY